MLVGGNGRIAGVDHSEAAEELAVGQAGVGCCAISGSLVLKVEHVKGVDVSGGELGSVDVLKEAGGLVEASDV